MSVIVPTITVTTPPEYAREIKRLAFAPRLHIDIADGEFAPNLTVNLNQVYWNQKDSQIKTENPDDKQTIDLHLMLKKPIDWLHQIVALNPDLVILHSESDNAAKDLPRIFAHVRKFGIKCGVALLPETQPDEIAEIIQLADHALIFGGKLGFWGGTADLSQLEKVTKIRAINPNIELAWDGGANAQNVAEIAAKGIDVINVGSAIAKTDDPEKTYKNLVKAISEKS